jgi:hypothetical protein
MLVTNEKLPVLSIFNFLSYIAALRTSEPIEFAIYINLIAVFGSERRSERYTNS